jgi:hypothetical protein
MSRYWDDAKQDVKASVVIRDTGIALVVMTTLIMGGCPHYRVWQQGLEGEAELKRAQQNRQIAIEDPSLMQRSFVQKVQQKRTESLLTVSAVQRDTCVTCGLSKSLVRTA